jgi:micrococcal nuclease
MRQAQVFIRISLLVLALIALTGCTFGFDPGSANGVGGVQATVTRVIDGDTIDVQIDGNTERIRYIGVNTPERDESCYQSATDANSVLVAGKTVSLVSDAEDTDQYGRLLRYVYVGDLFVNKALVEQGFAEAVSYPPNTAHYDEFVRLEKDASSGGRGCHPTGIFDDGSYTR